MDNYTYNDGLLPSGRRPRLYLVKGNHVRKFNGEDIYEWCRIVSARHKNSGEWLNTIYKLDLEPCVRPLHFVPPMHGTWGDSLGSWDEAAEKLGISVDNAQQIIRNEFEITAKRLNKLQNIIRRHEPFR